MSARDYYHPVWHFPFVVSGVRYLFREPEWAWFRHLHGLPAGWRPYAMGGVPFLYLIDEKVLEAICARYLKEPATAGNGELRFVTAANRCGYPPCGYSPAEDRVGWRPWLQVPNQRGLFHPVKHVVKLPAGRARRQRIAGKRR
jgi:hypothetical protein